MHSCICVTYWPICIYDVVGPRSSAMSYYLLVLYYNAVTWTLRRIKSPVNRSLVQKPLQTNRNKKAPLYCSYGRGIDIQAVTYYFSRSSITIASSHMLCGIVISTTVQTFIEWNTESMCEIFFPIVIYEIAFFARNEIMYTMLWKSPCAPTWVVILGCVFSAWFTARETFILLFQD